MKSSWGRNVIYLLVLAPELNRNPLLNFVGKVLGGTVVAFVEMG